MGDDQTEVAAMAIGHRSQGDVHGRGLGRRGAGTPWHKHVPARIERIDVA
jgi:hypothetical protein